MQRVILRVLPMSGSLYEIVELTNGEFALKRMDDDVHEPLVTIRFSEESVALLGHSKFAVAKAMIEAAMDAASDDSDDELDEAMLLEELGEIHQLH